MDSATNTTRDLAVVFLDCDRLDQHSRTELTAKVQATFERLRIHLSRRLGSDGYRALLARAIALAAGDTAWVGTLTVEKNGTLIGFAECAGSQSLSLVLDGSIEIVSRFFGLLETFVGRELSLRLLSDIWPEPVQVSEFDTKEDKNG